MINPEDLSPEQQSVHRKLKTDFVFFAEKALKITTKEGKLSPFILNEAQRYLHSRIEDQLKRTGKVRVIVLKGRQQGCSTYVAGRYYHRATWNSTKSIFILSHHSSTTGKLFQIVDRYYYNTPEIVRPKTEVANQRQLIFDNGSEYMVGTAKSGAIARGSTIHFFHGSEVAYFENPDEIKTGALQAVADVSNTEIILESTANGISGLGAFFYQLCMLALEGKSEFELVFIPWYWQDEYRAAVPPDHEFSTEEYEIANLYGLDEEQLYWRYLKIRFLGSEALFKQEYPCSIKEAFLTSGLSLLDGEKVQAARKSTYVDQVAPLIMGVDAARSGDRTIVSLRRGRQFTEIHRYELMDEMRLAGIVADFIDKRGVVKCFMDVASAYGAIDRLRELGYGGIVTGVHFGEKPINNTTYTNKRAEMAGNFRDWFNDGEVNIPDDEEIELELLIIPEFKVNSNNLRILKPKAEIIKEYGKSPDIFDAMMLTFAYPVNTSVMVQNRPKKTMMSKKGSPLTTLNQIRHYGRQENQIDVRSIDLKGF